MPARTKFFNNKAFTLIELLIVIVIIAILTALIAFSYTTLQRNARDTQRKNDLQTVAGALQRFYSDNSHYPTDDAGSGPSGFIVFSTTDCSNTTSPIKGARWGGGPSVGPIIDGIKCGGKTYIKSVPGDPVKTPQYCYVSTGNQNYTLYAHMEGSGNLSPSVDCGASTTQPYNYQVTPND